MSSNGAINQNCRSNEKLLLTIIAAMAVMSGPIAIGTFDEVPLPTLLQAYGWRGSQFRSKLIQLFVLAILLGLHGIIQFIDWMYRRHRSRSTARQHEKSLT